jgi:hypothetical protein
MLRRYGEVNFWFGFICDTAAEVNPNLGVQLTSPISRRYDEPVGKYEPESVPSCHLLAMLPMGTLAGYAIPRIFVEQLGTGQGLERELVQRRLISGLGVLDEVLPQARSPLELLALLSEGLVTKADLSPDQAFKHALSQGWLGEHGAHSMMAEFKQVMSEKAPTLWAHYQSLTPLEKAAQKLA